MFYLNKKNIIVSLVILFIFLISAIGFYYQFSFKQEKTEEVKISEQPVREVEKTATSSTYIFTKDNLVKPGESPGLSNKDSNNDGITDDEAKKMGLDPNKLDTDGDGIFDVDEINITKTDPLKKDTDGDGYDDLEELRAGYNPNGPGKLESEK